MWYYVKAQSLWYVIFQMLQRLQKKYVAKTWAWPMHSPLLKKITKLNSTSRVLKPNGQKFPQHCWSQLQVEALKCQCWLVECAFCTAKSFSQFDCCQKAWHIWSTANKNKRWNNTEEKQSLYQFLLLVDDHCMFDSFSPLFLIYTHITIRAQTHRDWLFTPLAH